MSSTYLTSAGLAVPRGADSLATFRERYETLTGLTGAIDWEADVVLGPVSTIVGDMFGELWELLQAVYDATDPNNATGVQLDSLCQLVGITREVASYSTVTLTLTGTSGTVIVEGSIVQGGGDDGKARWRTTDDVTLSGGTGSVVARAVDVGVVTANPATVTTIVTPIAGWTAVTNAAAAIPGTARESDAVLRRRRAASLQTAGSRSIAALRANLIEVDGVQAAVVIENTTSATAIIEGVSLTAHSVQVVLYPNTLTTDQKQAAAQAIYDHMPGGIAMNGNDVTATVTGGDGFAKTIVWEWATTTTVNIATTVTLRTGYVLADVDTAIQDLVEEYFTGLAVGESAEKLALLALVASVSGVSGATILLNGGSADIDPTATARCILGTNTVA